MIPSQERRSKRRHRFSLDALQPWLWAICHIVLWMTVVLLVLPPLARVGVVFFRWYEQYVKLWGVS